MIDVTTEVKSGEAGTVEQIASAESLFGARTWPVDILVPEPFVPCNPCPLFIDGELVVSVRTVDYRLGGKHDRSSSRNYLVTMHPDDLARATKCVEIVDHSSNGKNPHARTTGYEDLRLFVDEDGCLSAWATACDIANGAGIPEMCRLELDLDSGRIDDAQVIRGPWSRYPQKNWTPVDGDPNLVLYRVFPLKLLGVTAAELDAEIRWWLSGKAQDEDEHGLIPSSIRGSSQAVAFDGGYLVVVHEHKTKKPLSYVHRFVWLDFDYKLRKVSPEFVWKTGGVEFCCGMTSRNGEDFIAGFGVHDREAHLAYFEADRVRAVLRDLR